MGKKLQRLLAWFTAMALMLTCGPTVLATDAVKFLNGPYLLAPKTNSMVVAFEATADVEATVSYGTDAAALTTKLTVKRDADAPAFNGAPINLFHVKLDKLTPNTQYYYSVALAGGETCNGSFTTLSENPDDIRIMTLSDSHLFATKQEFDAAVKEFNPTLIIHCGDMVEGSGTQKEQFNFWFGSGEFLHNYPVVYACGNHDFGPYINAYIYNTQDKEYGGVVPGDVSFNYGDIHITLMNSNPWSLFQMNTESTGGTIDAATKKSIDDAMNWLKSDLAKAKDARFRILAMHHPKSDAYTNRYIPEIAEAGKVDLMLSGHTHTYARWISSNPAVGAGTVYLTHQDARTSNKKGDYMRMTIKGDLITVDNIGQGKVANTTLIAKEKQVLSYSDISMSPSEILSNGEVTIKATVKNDGKGLAAAVFPIDDNGKTKYVYTFNGDNKLLEPGESASLSGTITLSELGKHTLKFAGKTQDVNVLFRKATFAYKNIRTKLGDGKVSDITNNKLNIKADVTNIGNEAGKAQATLFVDGNPVTTKNYSLKAGEVKTVEFSHTFAKAGDYKVSVGNSAPVMVYIEGTIQGMPMVKDKSGLGNDGYIHGQPELGIDEKGRQTLKLDGAYDYIEIPDKKNYKVIDGATGMVWAKMPEGGTSGGVDTLSAPGGDHNTLLLKGVGLGWGTTYLFRIAVRSTGKVTYGICFDDDNGEFSWNDSNDEAAGIKKGKWVQYTSAFDAKTGGDSYQNGYLSGHIGAPAFTAPVKNWEGAPMYVGLGFTHALRTNRNRATNHTMLPAEVSQVRFYTSKVSKEENDYLMQNPSEKGDSAKNLAVWLDFDAKNLVTEGTHTTEWTNISAAPSALEYTADILGKSAIRAKVQTSDDGKNIKAEKEYTLANGQNAIALGDLGEAKYARIISTFVSDLNAAESHIPVLREYILKAGNEKLWNTTVDWSRGTFAGAAGRQSGDVYRNWNTDFDDYSGTASAEDSVGFTDINGHWAKSAITHVVANNLFKGISDTKFAPSEKMTRGMFVTVLGRLAKITGQTAGASTFKDVNASAFYAPYVAWATKNGIANGISANSFSPNAPITRQEMALMMQRFVAYKKAELKASNVKSTFTDDAKIASYAKDAVYKMQQTGIITGKPGNKFDPIGSASRAEVATMLQRLDNLLK